MKYKQTSLQGLSKDYSNFDEKVKNASAIQSMEMDWYEIN